MIEIDIEFVKALAMEAGQRALQQIAHIRPELKADSSYVTHIDRDNELFLHARLAERYPAIAFQGEEFGRHGSADGPIWAVDPIDGTTNLVFGIPFWCVSIGLVDAGEAVAGALYMPRTDELFWGVRGGGAYCNGVRLQAIDRDAIHVEDTLGFTSTANKTLAVNVLPGRIRCLGSIAAEIAYTGRGTLCGHVGCHEGANDIAAALCIAQEAGCIAAYLTGEPLSLGQVVQDGRTVAPFVIAPPQLAALLQTVLRPRRSSPPLR